MAGLEAWAPWISCGLVSLGAFAAFVAGHSRLKKTQESDRELLEQMIQSETQAREAAERLAEEKLKAETAARDAADRLADEKIKGWAERMRLLQDAADRSRDLDKKVDQLAGVMEGFGKDVAHAQEMAATQIRALAERISDSQDRTDARFEELRELVTAGR